MTCDTRTGRHQPSQAVSETRIPQEKPRHAPYVHTAVLQAGAGPLWVCKGACDVLALRTVGVPRVVAIFGVQGWRWDWMREVRELVPALDADTAGSRGASAPTRSRCGGSRWQYWRPQRTGGIRT
jgi:hypothetical protein